ncbi:MAG: cation:proton antiporter [Desulfurococcaceae archaeon]
MSHSLILDIAFMLIFAKILEIPFRKYYLNPIIAHVLAGFIVGNLLYLVKTSSGLESIIGLSIILIMLYTGLTTDFRELTSSFREVFLMSISGVFTTILFTYVFLQFIGLNTYASIFIAIVLSNTATETIAGILYRENDVYFKSIIIGASFIDDIIAVVFATIFSTISLGETSFIDLAFVLVKITLFLLVSFYLTNILFNKFSKIYIAISRNYYYFVSIVITLAFTLAFISKTIGLSELIGAYIAGLILARIREPHDPLLRSRINLINFISDFIIFLDALFIPLFFTYIGLSYSITSINTNLLVIVLLIALTGKVIGVYPVARYVFKNNAKAFLTSILMTGRGLIEIVLLKIGYEIGIIDYTLYTTILTVSLLTIVLTPLSYTLIKMRMK